MLELAGAALTRAGVKDAGAAVEPSLGAAWQVSIRFNGSATGRPAPRRPRPSYGGGAV